MSVCGRIAPESKNRGLSAKWASRLFFMVVVCMLWLSALPASAVGTYTVTYSGGTVKQSGLADFSYFVGTKGYGGMGGSVVTSCTGPITATFTWQPSVPGELPPAYVNIKESCQAYAMSVALAGASMSADANNDLGSTPVVTTNPAGATIVTKTVTCNGNRYTTKQNPGASFTVTCTPSASGSTASTIRPSTVSVYYTASTINHAHPCNMRMDPGFTDAEITGTSYALYFKYLWDSTSGKVSPQDVPLNDLAACNVFEHIEFSGAGQDVLSLLDGHIYFQPQSPPFGAGNILNPTETGVSAPPVLFYDSFNAPKPVANADNTYSAASFTGTQYYRFHCSLCMNDGEYQDLIGPLTIVRSIEKDWLGKWIARVSSRGYTSVLPLE